MFQVDISTLKSILFKYEVPLLMIKKQYFRTPNLNTMQEDLNLQQERTDEIAKCINCGSLEILSGYRNNLCAECRTAMINYPIPNWVKLFGVGILAVMLISMIWLPGNFKAALALSRADKAEKNHYYLTAQRELEVARKAAPNSIDVLADELIAAYYNNDLETVAKTGDLLAGKEFEDSIKLHRINYISTELRNYSPSDTFKTTFSKYKNQIVSDTVYRNYVNTHPDDDYAKIFLANIYMEKEYYLNADKLLSNVLLNDAEMIPALNDKVMVKRELNQLDSSLYYADKLLNINRESLYALSSKARTLLKMKRNKEGLELALKCLSLENNFPYNQATLALAYHFNKYYNQRDELLNRSGTDSATISYMQFARDVISNKVKFQN
ncbi:hypothetical protein MUY27_03510 [Mucilaginibacter sp. RS28]|uniref:Tetratricopeptide repeat protein n=1 Tax=Mucilaginibacter straminoryzae TaxID=2932774 RepID=A0A9X1X1T2_9SPHI|nr:hypothetical protein [Mucilaginibacter straminoryzae]MCJ8208760.1 hypothetical protein [Mucilaginibacter straminoryzae]